MDELVYDFGPQPPLRPVKPAVLVETPELPAGAEGPPDYEPALQRYTEAYRSYLQAMDFFPAERAAWEKQHGTGPVQISIGNAREAVARDPVRYRLQA